MLNKEKFKEEIVEIACSGGCLAINEHTNKLCSCEDMSSCKDCKFNSGDNCFDMRKDWCNSEYVESEVDWSKVPVDTPIYIRQGYSWLPRYFVGKCNDDGVYHFNCGKTSFTAEDKDDISIISFNNVKLARTQDIEKYSK